MASSQDEVPAQVLDRSESSQDQVPDEEPVKSVKSSPTSDSGKITKPIRRLLYEMGIPLPDSEGFSDYPNKYDKIAYNRIKGEFKAGNDYRIGTGNNRHLGLLYHYDHGIIKATALTQYPGIYKFKDEGGDVLYAHNFIEGSQWEHFVLPKGQGLTLAGLSRINRSIEAFVYCILMAQADTRSSIVGISGSAQETRQRFLGNFESAIIENDIAKSIQRYQLAVQSAKARLDFAITPGCWLFPSNLVINTGSIPGYNNKLQRVTKDMKFGVNDVNGDVHKTIPHFVEKSKKHLESPKKQPETPKKQLETLKKQYEFKEEHSDHTLQKIEVSAAAITLGYYIVR